MDPGSFSSFFAASTFSTAKEAKDMSPPFAIRPGERIGDGSLAVLFALMGLKGLKGLNGLSGLRGSSPFGQPPPPPVAPLAGPSEGPLPASMPASLDFLSTSSAVAIVR